MARDGVTSAARPHRGLFVLLIIATLIYVAALWPAIEIAMRAPMVPDEGVTIGVWLFVAAAFTLPFALLLSPLFAWMAYARNRPAIAMTAISLPPLWLVLMALTMVG
jgi:hypothetical protein